MATIDLTKRGPAGIDGTAIASGHGNPRADFGSEGWLYANLSSTALFRKESGVWVAKFFMKGLKGNAGKRGISLRAGSGAPTDDIGDPGDNYLDKLTGDIYGPKSSNGEWPVSPVGSLKGPQGVQGIQGIQGNVGTQGVQGIPGTPGTSVSPLVYAQLNKILASNTDIVASFIYDTRRDTDLGWWRFKCQSLSWYNETLGTSTRGMRREFPAVVAIFVRNVAATAMPALQIFDLTDIDGSGVPRLWMAFNSGGNAALRFAAFAGPTNALTSVFALQGRIFVGQGVAGGSGVGALNLIDLANDTAHYIWSSVSGKFPVGLSERNSYSSSWANMATGKIGAIVDRNVFAVHARAIAGSAVDAMGLTIPTVAVATAAGFSEILPSGVAWDCTVANGYDNIRYVDDNRIWASRAESSADDVIEFGPRLTVDIVNTSWRTGYYRTGSSLGYSLPLPSGLGGADALAQNAIGTALGLALFDENVTTPSQGGVAHITTAYNTGRMYGDTRGAFICEGVTGNLVGANVLSEDGTSTSGWTAINGATLASVSNELRITSDGTAFSSVYKSFTTVAGSAYNASVKMRRGTAPQVLAYIVDGAGVTFLSSTQTNLTTSDVVYNFQFIATGTTTRFYISLGSGLSAGHTGFFDDSIVDLAVADRSYKSKGLRVVGTLTRTAVNTGADVVLIGNSSSAPNYLEQPYNSDLDYGTGDFQWSGVVHSDNAMASTRVILDRYDGSTTASRFRVYINSSHQLVAHVGGTFLTGTSAVNTGQPVRWRVVRRSGSLELWVNGVLENSTANSSNLTLANAILRFFQNTDGTSQFFMGSNGKGIGRITTSAYAPTAAQIALADRDEASILQPDAKAFLGGSSNDVKAIDYDPDHEVHAVGTADGVSEFKGLRRFNYWDTTNCALTNDNMKCVSRRDGFRLYGGGADIIANRDLSFTADDAAMRAAYLRTLIPDTSLLATSAALAALSATVAGITVPVKGAGTDYWTGTDDAKFMTAKALRDAGALVPIASAATINLNGNSGLVFDLVLDHNASFALPTNLKNGETYTIIITQGTTGGTGAFNGAYDFRGVTPTLSVGAGKIDIVSGVYKASSGKLISSFSKAV